MWKTIIYINIYKIYYLCDGIKRCNEFDMHVVHSIFRKYNQIRVFASLLPLHTFIAGSGYTSH